MKYKSLFNVALFEPRIPQNTGNIGRTCLAFNSSLHLIYPIGFDLSNKSLRRAGLDYWKNIDLYSHKSFDSYRNYLTPSRIIGFSKEGGNILSEFKFQPNDSLLFGREDSGLSDYVKGKCDEICTIPMPGIKNEVNQLGVRSLNLSVACGIATHYAYISLNK